MQRPRQPNLLDAYLLRRGESDQEFADRIGSTEISVNRLRRGLQWPGRRLARAIRIATKGEITAASFDDVERIRRTVKPRRPSRTGNDEQRTAGA